jgi:hypothetical protein
MWVSVFNYAHGDTLVGSKGQFCPKSQATLKIVKCNDSVVKIYYATRSLVCFEKNLFCFEKRLSLPQRWLCA